MTYISKILSNQNKLVHTPFKNMFGDFFLSQPCWRYSYRILASLILYLAKEYVLRFFRCISTAARQMSLQNTSCCQMQLPAPTSHPYSILTQGESPTPLSATVTCSWHLFAPVENSA